jgi:hypothetical protein
LGILPCTLILQVVFNTALGKEALRNNTTASNNTAVGYQAMFSNTTGAGTAVGYQTLYANTEGQANAAFGWSALRSNTTGSGNTAVGQALLGVYNGALFANTTGASNTAVGSGALIQNTTASNNTAVGYQAGYSNTTAGGSTLLGYQAGYLVTGIENTAVGTQALYNTTGTKNTAIGTGAGAFITTGAKNTILGAYTGNQGGLDIRTSSNYIVLSDGDGNPRGIFDSSGNLLVGKTSADYTTAGVMAEGDGTVSSVKAGVTGVFNRLTTDGDIMQFRKDGTTVGSIGSDGGGVRSYYAGNNVGISPYNGIIYPTNGSGTAVDNTADLGASAYRFKNLYLSGGVYLGGTGSANHLDDYEEGTWTPVFTGLTIGNGTISGTYTKIGRQVTIVFGFELWQYNFCRHFGVQYDSGQHGIGIDQDFSGSGTLINFLVQNSAIGSIQTNGTTTSYVTSSDYRLKTDAQPMVGASACAWH